MAGRRESDLSLHPIIERRKPCSAFKCLLWSSIICIGITASICVALVFFYIYSKALNTVSAFNSPLSAWVHQNTTLEDVLDRSKVVRPLIDDGETFDIAASVWARKVDGPIGGLDGFGLNPESLLFSDVVFRGVSAKDRGIVSKVNFQVPTNIFKNLRHVRGFDLRGSFTLIPSSSHLLDHVVNATSWIADSVLVPPVRPINDDRSRTLLDDAINGYGVHVPLVEFHPAPSHCASNTENPTQKMDNHPHIVTRSHLRVVDFTNILNFDRFNDKFQRFRALSCGQKFKYGFKQSRPCCQWVYCYLHTLHFWETGLYKISLLQLNIPGEFGLNRTEWAYAPYLSASKYATGPEDFVSVPVNQENCDQSHNSVLKSLPDTDMVNVTWSITYSGRTPIKLLVGDVVGKTFSMNRTTDNGENNKLQYITELIHGIYGYKHSEKAHPRRTLIFTLLRDSFLVIAISIPSLLYWYTRVSIAGISVPGTAFVILSDTIGFIKVYEKLGLVINGHSSWSYYIFLIWITGPLQIILNLLRLKVIMRLQIKRRGLFLPIIKIIPSSHTERSSRRMDAKLWRMRFVVFTVITLVSLFMHREWMSTGLSDWEKGTKWASYVLQNTMSLVIGPLYFTGSISQIALNYKRHTFTSMYKFTSISAAILDMGTYLLHLPQFVGDIAIYPKLHLQDYIRTLVNAINLSQAIWYPSEEYKDGED